MAFLPFGFGGVGFGFGEDGINPEMGVGIGAAWIPGLNQSDPFTEQMNTQPNHHQRQGRSRKGRKLYGAPKPSRDDGFDISNLFGN